MAVLSAWAPPATSTATGSELWRTDGTAAGTRLVVDLAPGTNTGGPLLFFKGGYGNFAELGSD